MTTNNVEPFRPVWTDAHLILSEDSNLALMIRKSNHYHTQYSAQAGYMNGDKFCAHIQLRVQYTNGQATLNDVDYSDLLEEAHEWVRADAQKGEDDRMAQRIAREQDAANRGKLVTRVTGKTARDKQKRVKTA